MTTPTEAPAAATAPRLTLAALVALALAFPVLAGCMQTPGAPVTPTTYEAMGFHGDATGTNQSRWPSLAGHTLTILDHGAFAAYTEAKARFEALTGARVVQISQDDAGSALGFAILEKGKPSADILFGLDEALLPRGVAAGILEAYTPVQAARVPVAHRFFGATHPWPATPVDFGFIAINYDNHTDVDGEPLRIASLRDVADHAGLFVTQDPRTSSVGLGFLLITVAAFGEATAGYDWRDYWTDLFVGPDGVEDSGDEALVTAGWSEAYEQHFSRGYGQYLEPPGLGDKPIVVSYTESPAAEVYFETFASIQDAARVLAVQGSTWKQTETMAILHGAKDRVAAQAWIEFTLTDAFQELVAPYSAVYPVVTTVDANEVYGTMDPEPGTFHPASMSQADLERNLDRWVTEWRNLCERYDRCP